MTKKETRRIINEITERYCSKCEEWKFENSDNFYLISKSHPEKGYASECKICRRKRSIKDQKIFNLKNPNVKKAYRHNYYLENKDGAFQQVREWNDENLERKKENQLKWQQQNRDRINEYHRDRRKRRKHEVSLKEWRNCKHFFNNRCACCELEIESHFVSRRGKLIWMDFHKDHLYHDGKNDLSNCVPLCQSCNTSKHTASINQFYNAGNPDYTYEKYYKIYFWIRFEYKKYIQKKRKKSK